MDKTKTKLPPNLVLTALFSSGITIVISISYIILCIIALIYRFNCDAAEETNNVQLTWHTVYKVYFQDIECPSALQVENITQSHTVFVLVATTLCFSVLTLVTSIALTVVMKNKDWEQYSNIFVFVYVSSWVGSLVVDVTFGTHLGMDHNYLSNLLRDAAEYNFVIDALRQGAFILMAVAMKGYVALALNIMLILLLIVYSCDYQDLASKEQHSIHKVGALNAFDQPKRDNNWVQPEPISPYARGHMNNGYLNDDEPPRSPARGDYYPTQSFNRSDSWQHQHTNQTAARPFSYLEEIRRAPALKPTSSPTNRSVQDSWRRDHYAPPVPAPDYSPHGQRRLKSALKPGYM